MPLRWSFAAPGEPVETIALSSLVVPADGGPSTIPTLRSIALLLSFLTIAFSGAYTLRNRS